MDFLYYLFNLILQFIKNIRKENLLTAAKLYESNGVWAVMDNKLQKFYWSGRIVNLIK